MKGIILKEILGSLKAVSVGRLGVFGICPPCVTDEFYPGYLCDPCDSIVKAGGIKGWIAKKCSYEFTDITDELEWDAAILSGDVFGRVNGNRILGESAAAEATTKRRGSCGTEEVVKYTRTVTFQDAENDANLSVNDIYVFLRAKYPNYDFAFLTCDNDLMGFFTDVSAQASIVVPQTNDDDTYWESTFTFNEDIDSFPMENLSFLASKQLWTCFVASIVVTGAGGAVTVVDGATLQMTATVTPSNATDPTVTWSVINGTGTATINGSGLLSATSPGTVTVVATANDAAGVVGTLQITVTP